MLASRTFNNRNYNSSNRNSNSNDQYNNRPSHENQSFSQQQQPTKYPTHGIANISDDWDIDDKPSITTTPRDNTSGWPTLFDWHSTAVDQQQAAARQLQSQSESSSFRSPNQTNSNFSSSMRSSSYPCQLQCQIDVSGVSRLIGKGGSNIKQVEQDNQCKIQISSERQSAWVDVTLNGSTNQNIYNAFEQIKANISSFREKNSDSSHQQELPESKSRNDLSGSRREDAFNSGLPSSFNRRPFENDSHSSRAPSSNGFSFGSNRVSGNSSSNGFDQNTKQQSSSSTYGSQQRAQTRSSNGYSKKASALPAGDEDNSDEEEQRGSGFSSAPRNPSVSSRPAHMNKYNITSNFTSSASSGPKVDWLAMRRMDTHNDMTKWKDFPPVIKDFYQELDYIREMPVDQIEELKAMKNNIVVNWFDQSMKEDFEQKNNVKLSIPNPIWKFEQAFHNFPDILNEITKQNFTEPSPIQCQSWPIALKGQDFIGIAQTGTGKTLAFLLPLLIHIDNQPRAKVEFHGPKGLILSPTRELAIQIHQEVVKYSYRGIRSTVIYGGSSRKNQIAVCAEGVEIIIATPGRLNDLIMDNVIDVRSVTFLVLDEADRMLDMGFEPQIVKILIDIRPDRQTIMTSATWPEDIRRIASRYMKNPIQIFIGSLDLAAVHSVRQDIEIVKDEEKFDMLLDFIGRMDADDKAIVFVDRKASADSVSSELIRKHVPCQSIHGDREQCDREQAIEDLKDGTVRILIATDVASRGLDIQDITCVNHSYSMKQTVYDVILFFYFYRVVFNYDLPKSMEDYVHRVGRTGRAGKTGYALTLVTREDWRNAEKLIKILEEARQEVPHGLREMAERFRDAQEKKREEGRFGGGSGGSNYRGGNSGGGSFFGLGSFGGRGKGKVRAPVMNSGWSFNG
ncbi:unnamed protein product [Didymodactylos carnosus]|uniref:RNA helicase n=1 Tax=Didymodactylos carnosus TaxID=1234261 RepID=A0A813QDP7_9BILA|nr:unnamed protein product [Didymodactylos carnosus]CAF0765606.1 unnamed protein product [Didymodactylos carnosus]CAF3520936.1 unnamed protein product [Didymodactylos carnosus]CAF3546934.1 unnamed protein product [Didymodactylos carnosus]